MLPISEIQSISLPNSLSLLCTDATRIYFGDYCHVRIQISISVPLSKQFFHNEDELQYARRMLPDPLIYRRTIERMGVPSSNVDMVRAELINDLMHHAARYLGTEKFPGQFVRAELAQLNSGRRLQNAVQDFIRE